MKTKHFNPKHSVVASLKEFTKTLKGYGITVEQFETFAHAQNNQAQVIAKEKTILEIAGEYVEGDRNKTYKHPNENFRNIKNLWNAYLLAINGREHASQYDNITRQNNIPTRLSEINEFDVSMLMVLMKVARLATNNTHKDSLIDIAGYARCAERVLTNK